MRCWATMRGLCMLLGLLLLSVACGAKKLWGVDVGNKEEKGGFEDLLQKAAGQDSGAGGMTDDVGQALAALADMDLSKLSLSELCTNAIDAVIEIVQDEAWLAQFAEPGVIAGLMDQSGMAAMLGEDGMASIEKDDVMELLALEGSPILYKTKFYELAEKFIGKLVALRMDVADPAKLRTMVRDTLKASGFERDQINQMMEIVDNPEVLAQQISALLSDPTVVQELSNALESLTGAASLFGDGDLENDELMQMLAAMEDDPAMMEEMYNELMKDPAFAEAAKAEGGSFFNAMGGRPGGAAQHREL